ncbi:hypothetical protein AM588_10003100 [Phytophthora nicotianae]|uniref:Uncharacterized protein n=1 Tax=Phytophthora nicotianae TaxID=4792 RepID=A0A0W8D226_PHYNI|nr:hypothetical protein AM588_10003100 [Phytophthora nicotianae]
MGTSLSRSFSRFWNRNERRLLLVGLDGAGKTTILYHLRLGKAIASIPTVGFNVETIKYEGYKLNIWDVGGQDTLRPYWRHHFTGTQEEEKAVEEEEEVDMGGGMDMFGGDEDY